MQHSSCPSSRTSRFANESTTVDTSETPAAAFMKELWEEEILWPILKPNLIQSVAQLPANDVKTGNNFS